jgi:hypothetical protein
MCANCYIKFCKRDPVKCPINVLWAQSKESKKNT